jgi:hypothetical protein
MDDKSKLGKQLLEQPQPVWIERGVRQLARLTGMKLEQFDHVVTGLVLEPAPALVVVARTRAKYSLEQIADAIQPTKSSNYEGKPLYQFQLKPAGEGMLWCVEDRTLVFLLRSDEAKLEHLRGFSVTERKAEDVLPAPLYQTLKERLSRHQYLWVSGQLTHLGPFRDLLPLMLGVKGDVSWLRDLNLFALGIEPIDGLTLTGHFHLKTPQATTKFKSFLEGVQIEGAKSQKVEAPPPDVQDPVAQWVLWQVRGDVATVRELLNRGGKD